MIWFISNVMVIGGFGVVLSFLIERGLVCMLSTFSVSTFSVYKKFLASHSTEYLF